jgi:hypothetical protein
VGGENGKTGNGDGVKGDNNPKPNPTITNTD